MLGNYPLATSKVLCYIIGMTKKAKAPTLRQFQDRFPTEDSCLDHLMRTRFGETLTCGGCGKDAKYYRVKKRRSYACEHCGHQVYPTADTPFHRTRTSLRDWFYVMFLFCASRNGVAAKEVERQIGVTYKTAWRMCHEIRKYMAEIDGDGPLGGEGKQVEVDETFVGGRFKRGKRGGDPADGKSVVFGMLERGGAVMTRVVPNRKRATLFPLVKATVQEGTEVHTDEYHTYDAIAQLGFEHRSVNHSLGEYASPDGAGVNGLEGLWSQLKRGISGTHIHVSPKHLWKYLGEFEYRHNMRHAPHLMIDRLMLAFQP